jgi:hypothetical protein
MVVYTFTENDGLVWEGTGNGWESMHCAMEVLGNVRSDFEALGGGLEFAIEQIMVVLMVVAVGGEGERRLGGHLQQPCQQLGLDLPSLISRNTQQPSTRRRRKTRALQWHLTLQPSRSN